MRKFPSQQISGQTPYQEFHCSLLSLTCHGITKDFQRKNIVLKAEVLEERHTGDYISETFQNMLC